MRPLLKQGFVSEHTRQIRGEARRHKTWQLTENGREEINNRLPKIKKTSVLIRGRDGEMLEVEAGEAADRLDSNLTLLQVLMMVIAEGMLQYGDIRLGRIEKGDDTYSSIAAASILAKVSRDKYIRELCDKHENLNTVYGLASNKGYGTAQHIEGIKQHGITKWHRKTFGICRDYKL
jgi:ribonuclease HII